MPKTQFRIYSNVLVMDLNEKVRQFLIQKRKALGLSQEQFALLALGIKSRSRISDIETGRKRIRFETLDLILSNLNCDIKIIEH